MTAWEYVCSDCKQATFLDLQLENAEWAEKNFGKDRPSYGPLLGAVEELGELAHAHLKSAQGIRSHEDHDTNAKDAVGDVIIYLADYCTLRGWSLQQIVEDTWEAVSRRDWTKDPDHANEGNGLQDRGC